MCSQHSVFQCRIERQLSDHCIVIMVGIARSIFSTSALLPIAFGFAAMDSGKLPTCYLRFRLRVTYTKHAKPRGGDMVRSMRNGACLKREDMRRLVQNTCYKRESTETG